MGCSSREDALGDKFHWIPKEMTLSDVIRHSLSVRVDIVKCDHPTGDAKKGEESQLDLDCESVEVRSTLI